MADDVYSIKYVRFDINGIKEELFIKGLEDALEIVQILRNNDYIILSLKLLREGGK